MNAPERTPLWFGIILVILVLPIFSTPFFLTNTPPDTQARLLGWFFPAYGVISAVCAWICYPDRRALAWILAVLMLLSDLGMWALVLMPQS